jgi:hypothetical protein
MPVCDCESSSCKYWLMPLKPAFIKVVQISRMKRRILLYWSFEGGRSTDYRSGHKGSTFSDTLASKVQGAALRFKGTNSSRSFMSVSWGRKNASVNDGLIGLTAMPNCFMSILCSLFGFFIWRWLVEEVLSFFWARKRWKKYYMQYHCMLLIDDDCTYNITDCRWRSSVTVASMMSAILVSLAWQSP